MLLYTIIAVISFIAAAGSLTMSRERHQDRIQRAISVGAGVILTAAVVAIVVYYAGLGDHAGVLREVVR